MTEQTNTNQINDEEHKLGFIIPSYCATELHFRQLNRCIDSIRKHYQHNKIIIINDYSKFDIETHYQNDKNIIVVKSLNKGGADMQTFKIFMEYDLFDKAVIMQDSMMLENKLVNTESVENIKFLWHFTNHVPHWDIIPEPRTEYNIKNGIVMHTDLIRDKIKNDFSSNTEFSQFSFDKLIKKNEWVGCFGCLCIISKKFLIQMNSKVNFIDTFVKYTDNRDRRAAESIFALICHFVLRDDKFYESYDGLYYDGVHANPYVNVPTGYDGLLYCCRKFYFSKVSFNR